jgi:hypothetical protein
LTYGTVPQQVAALVVRQQVRDRYEVRLGRAEISRVGAPMQSLFAEFYLLLKLLGFPCQRRLVFGIDYLIGPLCIVLSSG